MLYAFVFLFRTIFNPKGFLHPSSDVWFVTPTPLENAVRVGCIHLTSHNIQGELELPLSQGWFREALLVFTEQLQRQLVCLQILAQQSHPAIKNQGRKSDSHCIAD